MIYRRPPQPLKELAFLSWLTALDIGFTNPAMAPPLFLTRALESGAMLKEKTVVRIAQEAAAAGVKELTVNEELVNPILLRQLTRALTVQASKLRKLVLKLSSRITYEDTNSLLADALKGMTSLETVSLIGGANDELLKALAVAQPPLVSVDFSYSAQVTDDGLEALLGNSPQKKFRAEFTEKGALRNLQHLNVWETQVSTKGCMLVLKYCQDLMSLMCQWTAEALVLTELKQCNAVRLEQLFINKEEVSGNLFQAIVNLCPCLKLLSIRRPKDKTLNLVELLSELPMLEEFSLLQFIPLDYSQFNIPFMSRLKRLYVLSLSSSRISLELLVRNCPLLTHLTLDGVSPELRNKSPRMSYLESSSEEDTLQEKKTFKNLRELRIISAYRSLIRPLDPSLIVSVMNNMTENIRFLHLDHCEYFQDDHFLSMLGGGSLTMTEDIRLSRASNLSDNVIHSFTRSCPRLKRLVLTKLSGERREQLERLKVNLESNNVNLEIITFSNRSLTENIQQM